MTRNTTDSRTRKIALRLATFATAGVVGTALMALAPAASASSVPTAAPAAASAYTCHFSWQGSYLYAGYSSTNTTNTEFGQTGNRVVEVQCLLTYWANRVGDSRFDPKGIDGEFGNNTRAAVINAQKVCFDDPNDWDGEVGPKTWPCLRIW